MPTVKGTFQFPSFIPGFFFAYFLRWLKKDESIESNTIVFFFKEMIYICICLCVCVYILCIILS